MLVSTCETLKKPLLLEQRWNQQVTNSHRPAKAYACEHVQTSIIVNRLSRSTRSIQRMAVPWHPYRQESFAGGCGFIWWFVVVCTCCIEKGMDSNDKDQDPNSVKSTILYSNGGIIRDNRSLGHFRISFQTTGNLKLQLASPSFESCWLHGHFTRPLRLHEHFS